MSIKVTGNGRIDQATAEIAIALRDASPGRRDQHYYSEAQRLRDEIMRAACKCCVDNECECSGRKTGPVTRTGEIIVTGSST